MTEYVDFIPSSVAPFQFNPTLDGQTYAAQVKWNLAGQRYYLELHSLDGSLVFNQALEGSPVGVAVQALTWAHGRVTVETVTPHGYRVGSTLDLTVSGCTPDTLNGLRRCLVVSSRAFSYAQAAFLGNPTVLGKVDYNLNLAGGYFTESSLVFREPSKQFEISP